MRMKDIQVGEVYEIGRNRGPKRGVEFHGLRGVVVKTHVNPFDSQYGGQKHVLLHALTKDGLISLAGGEPHNIWAQAREVATSEMVGEKAAARAKERALLVDMRRRQRAYEDEVARKLAEHMNVEPEDLTINTLTRDDGSYRVYRVALDALAVQKYLGTDG